MRCPGNEGFRDGPSPVAVAAIAFLTRALGFEPAEDSPSRTNDGRPKRWVGVGSPGAQTGIRLARADGERQVAALGNQHAGRVGFFLRVHDFDTTYHRMTAAGSRSSPNPAPSPTAGSSSSATSPATNWDLLGHAASS